MYLHVTEHNHARWKEAVKRHETLSGFHEWLKEKSQPMPSIEKDLGLSDTTRGKFAYVKKKLRK